MGHHTRVLSHLRKLTMLILQLGSVHAFRVHPAKLNPVHHFEMLSSSLLYHCHPLAIFSLIFHWSMIFVIMVWLLILLKHFFNFLNIMFFVISPGREELLLYSIYVVIQWYVYSSGTHILSAPITCMYFSFFEIIDVISFVLWPTICLRRKKYELLVRRMSSYIEWHFSVL